MDGFVVLGFTVFTSPPSDLCEQFVHILQGYFTNTVTIIWLPQQKCNMTL